MHCSIIYCNLHYRNDGGFDMWSCRRIDNGNCSGSYIERTENGVNACYLLISMAQNVYGSWYEIDQTTLDACIKLTTLQVGTVNCQSVMKKATTRTAKEMHKIAEAENIVEETHRGKMWKMANNRLIAWNSSEELHTVDGDTVCHTHYAFHETSFTMF